MQISRPVSLPKMFSLMRRVIYEIFQLPKLNKRTYIISLLTCIFVRNSEIEKQKERRQKLCVNMRPSSFLRTPLQ